MPAAEVARRSGGQEWPLLPATESECGEGMGAVLLYSAVSAMVADNFCVRSTERAFAGPISALSAKYLCDNPFRSEKRRQSLDVAASRGADVGWQTEGGRRTMEGSLELSFTSAFASEGEAMTGRYRRSPTAISIDAFSKLRLFSWVVPSVSQENRDRNSAGSSETNKNLFMMRMFYLC